LHTNHTREARARARAREERQFPTNRTRVSFARVLAWSALTGKKTIFRKTQSSRAEKGKRECASWIRARPSLHTYLRRAATPTSRRWKGVHAALEFGVLRVEKWMGMRGALLVARSARNQQVARLKSCYFPRSDWGLPSGDRSELFLPLPALSPPFRTNPTASRPRPRLSSATHLARPRLAAPACSRSVAHSPHSMVVLLPDADAPVASASICQQPPFHAAPLRKRRGAEVVEVSGRRDARGDVTLPVQTLSARVRGVTGTSARPRRSAT